MELGKKAIAKAGNAAGEKIANTIRKKKKLNAKNQAVLKMLSQPLNDVKRQNILKTLSQPLNDTKRQNILSALSQGQSPIVKNWYCYCYYRKDNSSLLIPTMHCKTMSTFAADQLL